MAEPEKLDAQMAEADGEPEDSGEQTAPEEDFFEADASADTELEDDDGGDEYDTEEEAPEEVSVHVKCLEVQGSVLGAIPRCWRRMLISPHFCGRRFVQALETEAARMVARKERERLKLQDKLRKEQIEKMRQQLNSDAAAGDVSTPQTRPLRAHPRPCRRPSFPRTHGLEFRGPLTAASHPL